MPDHGQMRGAFIVSKCLVTRLGVPAVQRRERPRAPRPPERAGRERVGRREFWVAGISCTCRLDLRRAGLVRFQVRVLRGKVTASELLKPNAGDGAPYHQAKRADLHITVLDCIRCQLVAVEHIDTIR